MADLERKYADKPVHFFHVMCGENAIQALDFKKHYRSEAAYLLDTDYTVSEKYQGGSWPTTVLIAPDGTIAGRWLPVTEPANWTAALAKLDELIPQAQGGPPKGAYCIGDKCFVRTARDVFDSGPTMTTDGQGRVHLVFTREKGGSGDLFHQVLEGGEWSQAQRVTRSAADDYSPAICADGENGVRLVWCSNRAASGKYDVWTARFDGKEWSAPEQVTETDDDAAHPRCAVDTKGNFWVTYYRWVPWGEGQSRDREIYVRYHDGKTWSEETQISPTNVPRYEDHADPSIAADANGSVWVAWAWDTHPDEKAGWPYPPTFGSAIFTRQLRAGQPPSVLEMVAMQAASLSAAKQNANWAFLPEVCVVDRTPWFAFEAHMPGFEHACAVTERDADGRFPAPDRLGINDSFVCQPRLIADRTGKLVALWSARLSANYTVSGASRGSEGAWSRERVLWSDPDATLRFATGAFDADNNLWLAAVRVEPRKTTVATKKVTTP